MTSHRSKTKKPVILGGRWASRSEEVEIYGAVIPSGQFISVAPPFRFDNHYELPTDRSPDLGRLELFNPMLHPYSSLEYSGKPVLISSASPRSKDARCISEGEFASFGQRLVEIATEIARNEPPDCVIAPLRGALKPALLLRVLRDLNCVEYLPFQNRTDTHRRYAMENALSEILTKRAPDRDTFRVLVVDTAIGGYGTEDLSEMILDTYQCAGTPRLNVSFHLLHETARARPEAVDRIESVGRKSTDRVSFNVQRHSVPNLIVEDWDPALGVNLRLDGDVFHIELKRSPGVLYLDSADGIREIETSDLSLLLLEKMAHFTSEAILTDPRLRQTGVVWREYLRT